jgi:hypothetical protein
MLLRELDELAKRSGRLGFESIADYCAHLERALQVIASAESGVWGQIAAANLKGVSPASARETGASAITGEDE